MSPLNILSAFTIVPFFIAKLEKYFFKNYKFLLCLKIYLNEKNFKLRNFIIKFYKFI